MGNTSLPLGKKAIGFKWVYKVKFRPNGSVERYKATLVTKGYNQIEGIDFHEAFSLVSKLGTICLVLTMAIAKHYHLHQINVNNAFLHRYIDEDIYMLPPKDHLKVSPNQVCKLKRPLYGLKQASCQWNSINILHRMNALFVTVYKCSY